ncbi:Uncharacterized protein FWK35_00000676, partial [Aphis craccivora]
SIEIYPYRILSGAMNVLILQCCVFFFLLYTRKCRNNASISSYGGGSRWQKESSWCIKQFSKAPGKTKKKIRKNRNFYVKPVFDQIDFFNGCNFKTNHCKYLKFSPNLYVSVIYIHSKFYEICRKRKNLQRCATQIFFMRTTASIFFLLCFLYAAILLSLVVGGVRMRLVKAYSGQFCGCKNIHTEEPKTILEKLKITTRYFPSTYQIWTILFNDIL